MWYSPNKPFLLPTDVKQALSKLHQAGFVAYLVGGCVRDFLLGLEVKDFDLATEATPDQVLKIFPDALAIGHFFGVIKLKSETSIEIATFREEKNYKDHRRPSNVKFSNAEKDAFRRDFTVNGLFYDLKTQRVLDYVGGTRDLEAKTIRAIGDPLLRFEEDALRLLRAIRFASRLGFNIELQTFKALKSSNRLIKKISFERIRDEIERMLQVQSSEYAFRKLIETGLLDLLLPEAKKVKPELFKYLDLEIKLKSPSLVWASLLSEVGGEDVKEPILKVAERFKLSQAVCHQTIQVVSDLSKFNSVFQMREATLLRWMREPWFKESIDLSKAHVRSREGNLMAYEFALKLYENHKNTPEVTKLVTGNDLIDLGFVPSREFSRILKTIDDLTLESKLHTKEQAIEYILKNLL